MVSPGQPASSARRRWPASHPPDSVRTPEYLRTLLFLLVSATFFEGYDNAILALLLRDVQNTFSVSEATLGLSRGLVEIGHLLAFFFTRLGDRWGRRPAAAVVDRRATPRAQR